MMAEEKDVSKYPPGFRFNPYDHELINFYLKPIIMGKQLPSNNIINFKQVYGPSSNPWSVFDDHRSWIHTPALKDKENFIYVFAELTKLSRSGNTCAKNTSKKAGCGTWVGKGKRDHIVDGKGNVIGDKRYLVFEINDIDSAATGLGFDLSKVGFYGMHEYSLSGVNAGLNSAASIVICKITHDSSKDCLVNLKSGTKVAGNVLKSSSEAHVKEENSNVNLEGTSIVTAENLAVIDSGVGGNLEESRTLNSESLFAINSDVGDPYAAAQYNSGVQELDAFGDGLSACEVDWIRASLDSNHLEEPFLDSSSTLLGKRKFQSEENLHQSKKMCPDYSN